MQMHDIGGDGILVVGATTKGSIIEPLVVSGMPLSRTCLPRDFLVTHDCLVATA